MDPLFFRVEHGLLRSEAFKELGGSAIKVYLVIGLYSDFGSGWAYPSIRTIARQAGLSRQTVLAAIEELASRGLLATSKSKGKSTAYKVIREAPGRPAREKAGASKVPRGRDAGVPDFFGVAPEPVPKPLGVDAPGGPVSLGVLAQFFGPPGPGHGPEREATPREDHNTSLEIPGTPFRISVDGRLLVAVDLQELLTSQGIPRRLAERLAAQKAPEDVAKVLLNALYLQSQGKLQNGPGYIRAGLEDGYDLLPQVANRLENRRRELEAQVRTGVARREQAREEAARQAEEDAMRMVLGSLRPDDLQQLVRQAVAALPEPIVRRNPTLSNPFVRTKVYELAGGDPLD